MIETLKYATISSIYVKDIFFYSINDEKKLIDFHNNYGISYFPSKDRKSIFKYDGEKFVNEELTESFKCKPNDLLFDDSTIKKFEENNHDEVLFVTDNDVIIGVVHIVDYNNEFIYFEFYKLIFYFENMLREFLELKGESNKSLLNWMKDYGSRKGKDYWKNQYNRYVPADNPKKLATLEEKRKNLKPFQTFLMSDLLQFGISKKYFSDNFKKYVADIKNIRNRIAHSTDFTGKSDTHASKSEETLYKIDELKKFIKEIKSFFNAYNELEELVKSNKMQSTTTPL